MGRDLTKRYVDEVLEVSGVKKKGIERIREISQMPDLEVRRLLDDLDDRGTKHYSKNLRSTLEDLRGLKGQPKAYHFGNYPPIQFDVATPDWFIRKSGLYYSKIVIEDPLERIVKDEKWVWTASATKRDLMARLELLSLLWPWIAEGIVEVIPPPTLIAGPSESIYEYGDEDFQDTEGWQAQTLKFEDMQLEGEALLRQVETFARQSFSQDYMTKTGSLKEFALKIIAMGNSINMGKGFFGSLLTGASPTTNLRQAWRLFGYWVSGRAKDVIAQELGRDRWESFVSGIKAGRAWLAFDAKELGVLSKLPPERIVEIRDSADYSFQSFRDDLGHAVDEIQGLKLDNEADYRQAASQVWSRVRWSAKDVKDDMDTIKKKIGLEAGVLPMSLILGLLPFDMARVVAAAIGTPRALDIAKEYLELRKLKKSIGYFLVKLEEFA